MKKPIVAIIGRPNVGKSTFFNKVVGKRISIVKDEPGVTRDRIYADAEWLNHKFWLVDTGGIDIHEKTEVNKNILNQVQIAMELADVIIMLTDGICGLTAQDEEVAMLLKKIKKPVVLAVNKCDNNDIQNIYEFYSLGLGDPFPISSEHSQGVGDLLDEVVKHFDEIDFNENADKIKIAIVGKPNAGKSSITNKLLGESRMVVSNIAGTTRDAIDTPFTYEGKDCVLIDTAGIRRKRSIELESVESYSVLRSMEAIRRADVVIIVFDASEGLSDQDIRIAGYVHEQGKPSIVVINKWDLVNKDDHTINFYKKKLDEELNFMSYYIPVFVSAKTGQRINTLMPEVLKAYENANKKTTTSILNEILQDAVSISQPPSKYGRRLKFYFISQTAINPPTYTIQANDSNLVHFSYQRYLENCLRRNIDLSGTPIKIEFVNKNEK
ncbi:MAG TPA: ribosome biogenesis GTPase Der [Clostridiales bacterium]|nr:ribosome biogenesis GTPase Der [Clostridiales bacterium]